MQRHSLRSIGALAVAGPLVMAMGLSVACVATRHGGGGKVALGPVAVESLQRHDVRFLQLDHGGIKTSITHFFRELKPDKADAYTVRREREDLGTIVLYRLRNIGTADVYDLHDVPVKKFGGEWTITAEGWLKIRDELQAKMRVRLGRPTL